MRPGSFAAGVPAGGVARRGGLAGRGDSTDSFPARPRFFSGVGVLPGSEARLRVRAAD